MVSGKNIFLIIKTVWPLLVLIDWFDVKQNRRAKWRKREPPRKTGYIGPNSPSTNLGTPLGPPFSSFSQTSAVSPPGSVDSWNSYQPYELSSHFNLLSPAASPYGTFSGQYGAYVHESQIFPVRQHFDYGSPPRVGVSGGGGVGGGGISGGVGTAGSGISGTGDIDDKVGGDHYAPIDDKFDAHCSDG